MTEEDVSTWFTDFGTNCPVRAINPYTIHNTDESLNGDNIVYFDTGDNKLKIKTDTPYRKTLKICVTTDMNVIKCQ